MVKQYSKTGSKLKPFVMDDATLLAVGRLVRACAEIEDVVTLHLCKVAGITERHAAILIGRVGIAAKVAYAQTFAKALGGEAKKVTDECFESDAFTTVMACRNVLAHGVLLGQTDAGEIAFKTATPIESPRGVTALEVTAYKTDDFPKMADIAEQLIPAFEVAMKLRPLREIRRGQDLSPHSKAQPTKTPSAKHQRQRKPSRKLRQPPIS